jgi:dienelactone hydrolase
MFDSNPAFDSNSDFSQNLFPSNDDSNYGLDPANLSGQEALMPTSDLAYAGDNSYNNSLGLTQDNSSNYAKTYNSQSDPLTGTEAIAGSEDSLMLESGESGTKLPDLRGSYSVGTTNYDWVDPMRDETYTEDPTDKRELAVKVWYPSEKVAEGKTAPYIDNEEVAVAAGADFGLSAEQSISLFDSVKTNSISEAPIAETESDYPVLVLSPGLGGLPEEYTAQAEQLASQGYVVVGINHPYDAAATEFSDGRIVQQSPKIDDSNTQVISENIDIRAADAQFVLDKLESVNNSDPQKILTQHLDLDHVGIFGHSDGGATATEMLAQDPRFDAGLNMDGSLFKAEESGSSLTKPFMLMNSETALVEDPSRQPFYENLPKDAYNLTIKGSSHLSFSDGPLLSNLTNFEAESDLGDSVAPTTAIDSVRGATIINDYTLAFFDKYLKNEPEPLLEGSSPDYPEVAFESHQDK